MEYKKLNWSCDGTPKKRVFVHSGTVQRTLRRSRLVRLAFLIDLLPPLPRLPSFKFAFTKIEHSKKYAVGLWSISVGQRRLRCCCATLFEGRLQTSGFTPQKHGERARRGWRWRLALGHTENRHGPADIKQVPLRKTSIIMQSGTTRINNETPEEQPIRGHDKVFGWKSLNKLCYITEGRKATLNLRDSFYLLFFLNQIILVQFKLDFFFFFCVNRVGSQCLSTPKTRKEWK